MEIDFCVAIRICHRIEDKRNEYERKVAMQTLCRLFNQFERCIVQLIAQKPALDPEQRRQKRHMKYE